MYITFISRKNKGIFTKKKNNKCLYECKYYKSSFILSLNSFFLLIFLSFFLLSYIIHEVRTFKNDFHKISFWAHLNMDKINKSEQYMCMHPLSVLGLFKVILMSWNALGNIIYLKIITQIFRKKCIVWSKNKFTRSVLLFSLETIKNVKISIIFYSFIFFLHTYLFCYIIYIT